MNIVLCTREEELNTLSHGAILCTQEEADEYLMHWRTKGSKNGERLYQYEDGSLTPLGRIHYGIGEGNRHARKAEKYAQKAYKSEEAYEKASMKYEKTKAKAEKTKNPDRAKKLQEKAAAQEHKVNMARLDMDKWRERTENANKRAEEQEKRGLDRAERDREIENGNGNVKPSRAESIRSALETGHDIVGDILGGMERRDRERSEKKFAESVEKFDKLSSHDQKLVGDEVLNRVSDFDNHSDSKVSSEQANMLRTWMFERINKKSGNWNTGESVSKTHKMALDKLNASYSKELDRVKEIKKEIDYVDRDRNEREHPILSLFATDEYYNKESKRLKAAIGSDRVYKALKEASAEAEKDFCGTVLKDIGFSDTPENRSLIFAYVFLD